MQFYSENGSLLYEKQLHTESIINIRYVADEITVFYPSCIIVLQTLHLIPLLKSLREMYSKAKTTKIDLMDKDYILAYKRWDYKSNDILISDALMIPQQKTCLFDHLLNESLELGFTNKYRIVPSQNASVVAIGTQPFVSFHSAREGFKQNVFTDVAKAVVNKITSRLPGWLTGSQPQTSADRSDEAENFETLYPRHELIDYQRTGCNIYAAPINYQLVAITDSLGRIILVDTDTGLMIRMWKGYRDAQCGFMEIVEARNRKEHNSESSRRAGLFLIIYAPRKSILEIWCMQKGPKVATFQASKNGFLIYNSHDMSNQKYSRSNKLPCLFFFDADDNSIKNFSIPFHCILSETNSKSAEDFHYLKRLKMTLKNVDLQELSAVPAVIELCEKLQTPEIKLKCLELLTTYKKTEPSVIKSVIEIFLKSATIVKEKDEDEDHASAIQDGIYREQLTASCLNYKSLIECYLMAKDASVDETRSIRSESIELLESEFLTVQRIVELMSFSKSKEPKHSAKNVSFKDDEEYAVAFLTSFVVNGEMIHLNAEHHQIDAIGGVLFSNAWREQISMSQLLDVFGISRIQSDDIMKCFLYFWLQQEIDFSDEESTMMEMTKFKNILDQVCLSAGDKVMYAYNSICLFWQDVREYLLESNNPINSLLAAIVCKNYALKKQSESQDFGFEQVTQEECQWTLLTEKLNDVAVLSIFVSQFATSNQMHKEKYEAPNISLKKILNDGKGVISEIVASWLIGVNLPIRLIFKLSTDEDLEEEERNFIKKLEILRQHFPYSLNASVILCYVVWNLLSTRWSKNLSEIHFLKSGIEHLALFKKSDYHLKHGLCVMLWNANFKIPLKATQKLINKTGRLPKEKLCLQNTMIPDFLIPQFLEQTLIFIEIFRDSLNYNKLEFKCEEILQQGSASHSLSLCEHVLQQPRGNAILLNLHYEMIMVLELIAFLNIKYTKPMQSLFDEVSNDAFFMDINKQLAYALQKSDEIRQNTRVYFLKKAVSTTIDLIVECQQSIYFDDHLKWIEKIKKIANVWELDVSLLERHQILELYVYGFDDLADELLEKVSSREIIVKSLLDIAAKRLDLHLQADKSGWLHVASGGSLLTNYLETIHGRKNDTILENVKSSVMDRIYRLTYKIFQIASLKNFTDSRALR